MTQKSLVFIFMLLSASCKENKISYEFLVFRDNNIKIWPDSLDADLKDQIENGKFSITDVDGTVIAEGEFDKGLKIGEWRYHPSSIHTVKIEWARQINKTVTINFPVDWKIIESNERPFQASFPVRQNTPKKDKFFIILPQKKDSIGMNLKNYWLHYCETAFQVEKVKEFAFFEFETVSGKFFYFSRYILQKDTEEVLVFSFLGEIESTIYDITYSSLSEEYEKKHIIFFDMLRSLVLENRRFFSPFDPVKKFSPLNKPPMTDKRKPTV